MARERRKSGRRRTDRRASDKLTLTNENGSGAIQHDDRGDARWVFPSEQQAQEALERTFDELKALDNVALALQSDPSRPPKPLGYNPYDTPEPAAPKVPARKSRR